MWMIRVENLPHFLSQKNGRNNAEFWNRVPHRCFIKSLIVTVKNLPHRLDFSILAFYVGKKSQCSEVIVHLIFQISHYLTLTIPDRKSLSGWMTFQSRLKASHISTFDAVILPSLCAVLDWSTGDVATKDMINVAVVSQCSCMYAQRSTGAVAAVMDEPKF